MGTEFLTYVRDLLRKGGIRAGEEYPAGRWVQIQSPVAAVGLSGMDPHGGVVHIAVRVLSPRILGGWECQCAAAEATRVLYEKGLTVRMGQMSFLEDSDCFCIELEVTLSLVAQGDWPMGQRWKLTCGGEPLTGVESFRAVRDQGRRVVGTFCQSDPVAVTPGNGGWALTLVQWCAEEDRQTEPFTLTVEDGERQIVFSGCHWNTEQWEHLQQGLRRTRTGFALKREVQNHG